MKLIAKKPCGFGGKKFYIGEEIPAEYVLDPKAQEKMGVLVIVGDGTMAPAPEAPADPVPPVDPVVPVEVMEVVIHEAEGDRALSLTKEGLQAFLDVITRKPSEAKPIIEQMTDGDALILLHFSDKRNEIKSAAENRAKALIPEDPEENPVDTTEESEGEQ